MQLKYCQRSVCGPKYANCRRFAVYIQVWTKIVQVLHLINMQQVHICIFWPTLIIFRSMTCKCGQMCKCGLKYASVGLNMQLGTETYKCGPKYASVHLNMQGPHLHILAHTCIFMSMTCKCGQMCKCGLKYTSVGLNMQLGTETYKCGPKYASVHLNMQGPHLHILAHTCIFRSMTCKCGQMCKCGLKYASVGLNMQLGTETYKPKYASVHLNMQGPHLHILAHTCIFRSMTCKCGQMCKCGLKYASVGLNMQLGTETYKCGPKYASVDLNMQGPHLHILAHTCIFMSMTCKCGQMCKCALKYTSVGLNMQLGTETYKCGPKYASVHLNMQGPHLHILAHTCIFRSMTCKCGQMCKCGLKYASVGLNMQLGTETYKCAPKYARSTFAYFGPHLHI